MNENKEYVSRCDELGNIHISEEVLSAIAAAAAMEVKGVSGLAAHFGDWLGKKYQTHRPSGWTLPLLPWTHPS